VKVHYARGQAEVGRSHSARACCELENHGCWPFPHLQTWAACCFPFTLAPSLTAYRLTRAKCVMRASELHGAP